MFPNRYIPRKLPQALPSSIQTSQKDIHPPSRIPTRKHLMRGVGIPLLNFRSDLPVGTSRPYRQGIPRLPVYKTHIPTTQGFGSRKGRSSNYGVPRAGGGGCNC